jgi:Alpha amylase, catalytic domain
MKPWPKHPIIYEINIWVWLSDLSRKYKKPVSLATVPDDEWDAIASCGFDVVWLMGVWERSPVGIEISMRNKGLLEDFRQALPDFSPEDNVGSPYCVRRYVIDKHLCGTAGLAAARNALAKRGIRLFLDFVPNHVAPDHPWVFEHPEYFLCGDGKDLKRDAASFVETGETFSPADVIRTSRLGLMCCNSTPSTQDFERLSSIRSRKLRISVTAFGATWRCSS